MARDPLDEANRLLRVALAGDLTTLDRVVHRIATDAFEEANEMEEAADEVGVALQTLALVSAESLRALATAVVAALAAAPAGSAIQIDIGKPITVSASTDPDQLVLALAQSLRAG